MTKLQHLSSNWKTTAQSILTSAIGIVPVFMGLGIFTPRQALFVGAVPGIAKVIIGLLQQDAGTAVARVAGAGEQVVSSHEVPDDPNAKPILQ